MTDEEEHEAAVVGEIMWAFKHRSAGGSVEAFAYDLANDMISAFMCSGFPASTQRLLQKLEGSHEQPYDLERLSRRELIAVRKCLHALSYRPEIGDWPVRMAIRNVVKVRPLIH